MIRMRIVGGILLFVTCHILSLHAQELDLKVSSIRMNYAIPDAPAFKILNTQPDNIMRPSTTQELAVSMADPFLGQKLPSAFALEFSPYLTIGGSSLTLKDYQTSAVTRILYHTRVSIASQRSTVTNATTVLAFGLRFTLYDDSDLRLDTTYINKLYDLNDLLVSKVSGIRGHFRPPSPIFVEMSQEQKDSIESLVQDSLSVAARTIDSKIAAEREQVIKGNWNKTIVEAGLAIAGASADSTSLSGIVGKRAEFWLVAAGAIDRWGQWVLGLNTALGRRDNGRLSRVDGSLSSRLYVGENAYKGFIQFESEIVDGTLQNLVQLGGELRLYEIVWADFSAGFMKMASNKPTFTSNFNIRFATPKL